MIFRTLLIGAILVLLGIADKAAAKGNTDTTHVYRDAWQMEPRSVFDSLGIEGLRYEVFKKAYLGYLQLRDNNRIEKNILTIIDYELASVEKRLWVIDLEKGELLYCELVAHGKNSGENIATQFSNTVNSYQSCLGLFTTDQTYYGKHGLSLRIDGMEEGINDNARKRAIVIHGANYVSEDFIRSYGRLGRSHGCPALPKEKNADIVKTIANKSCIYIHGQNGKEEYRAQK